MMKKISFTTTAFILLFFSFNISSQANNFSLVGDGADLSGGCYQLTTTNPSTKGAIWSNDPIDLSHSFIATFQLDMGFFPKADGATFALHRDPLGTSAIGWKGHLLGYAKETNIYLGVDPNIRVKKSLAVAFRGYFHGKMEIWKNGIFGSIGSTANIASTTGLQDVTIEWNAETHTLTVDWGNDGVDLTYTNDIVNTIFDGDPSNITWGFTASTGRFTYQHRVCDIQLVSCNGLEATAEVVSHESGCGAGSPNRVIEVIFEGVDEQTTYTMDSEGATFINPKGMGIYQVVGNGAWSIEAMSSTCTKTITSANFVYATDAAQTPESGVAKNDGTATIGAIGGVPPYTINWNNGTSSTITNSGGTHTLTGLSSGHYEATITDDNGEIAKACIYVNRNTPGRRGRGKNAVNITDSNALTIFPNPFHQYTNIQFSLPQTTKVWLTIYSLEGRKMGHLLEGATIEEHILQQVDFENNGLQTGSYILELRTEEGMRQFQQLVVLE